jgi:hypothetical protein
MPVSRSRFSALTETSQCGAADDWGATCDEGDAFGTDCGAAWRRKAELQFAAHNTAPMTTTPITNLHPAPDTVLNLK